jgi:hypothetical protein
MTGDQWIAVIAIVSGATATAITAYLANRRARDDRQHARDLADDERANTRQLAREERLFASRRQVYEDVLRFSGHLVLIVDRTHPVISLGGDDPPPPPPSDEEQLQLRARLAATGSPSVDDAFLSLRKKVSSFFIRASAYGAIDRHGSPQWMEARQAMDAAREEARAALRELEALVRDELTRSD